MNEENVNKAFEIISYAGNARASAVMATENAREGKFDESDRLIKEAQKDEVKAHELLFELLRKEASGENYDVDLMIVHAQDHLTMASLSLENAKEFNHIYKLLLNK